MRIATIFPLLLATAIGGSTVAKSQEIARWSFEQSDEAAGPAKISSRRVPNVTSEFSDDVPGAYLYDPLTKRSRPNTASAKFNGSDQKSDAVIADLKDSIQANQSLTIEAFIKPSQ
jgi:hypothetical protein